MSEDADIKDDGGIEILPPKEGTPKLERRIGYKTLGISVIIASILGAGGGAMLSKTVQKPAVNISPLRTNIEALQSENKTLKAQVTRLQRDVKAQPKPAAVDLTNIEARLDALENAKPKEIDPDLVTRLEALNEEGSEALDLSDIIERIEALETRPPAVSPAIVAPVLSAMNTSVPFPEAAILATLETSQSSGSWLKRSLKKHISVQSDDNPHYLLEVIVQNIEDGNIEAALSAFDKLPDEAKAAAQAWRESLAN